MDRVALRSSPPLKGTKCWHCGSTALGARAARYLYQGDRPKSAIVEDWHQCGCGAYQNVRRPAEITVSPLDRG